LDETVPQGESCYCSTGLDDRMRYLERLLQFVAKGAADSPHIEFSLQWCLQLLQSHDSYMDSHRVTFMGAFRAMYKAIQTQCDVLKSSDQNRFMLGFIEEQQQESALPPS